MIDLPGVKVADLKVTVKKESIHVQGERKYGERVFNYTRKGSFDERKVDASKMVAYLADGVLTITAPPKHVPDPTLIPISTLNETDNDKEEDIVVEKEEQVSVETVEENEDDDTTDDEKEWQTIV